MTHFLGKIMASLQQRGFQTVIILTVYVLTAGFLPYGVHQGFYTVSLFLKDVLMWGMPLTVGFFIAHTVTSFERRAPLLVLTLLIFETVSNFSSVWYAFGSATFAADYLPLIKATTLERHFQPLWRIPLSRPEWWSAEKGALAGLIVGCLAAFSQGTYLKPFLEKGKTIVEWMLTRGFSRLIPLFVLGFTAHMVQTKLLDHVVAHYAVLVLWLTFFLILYIVFLFVLSAGLSGHRMVIHIKNLLPAGGMAFTSGCSLSTMPWTIEGSARNLQNPLFAKVIIPATTNIQQIGDCIAQAFLCFLIYRHFYGQNPELVMWALFSGVFVLARFATAAVLGGAIFIMLPIYETYLHFTPEMIAIILALNVVLDPVITSCNVMANGALCRVFEKVWVVAQRILIGLPSQAPSEAWRGAGEDH
ncbi:MAG: hypothetical protein K0R76_317 [Alphaproteobacteria bacterium]|jgi:hypothetical protein|nr:hypothetical protein [Alphaproteobacteria bacterium]